MGPGQGVAWSRLVDLMGVFWADIALRVAARHRAGRLKQWLNAMRRVYPEAQEAFDELRLVHEAALVDQWLQKQIRPTYLG
jgi:tRNA-dihydrouridine synthase C